MFNAVRKVFFFCLHGNGFVYRSIMNDYSTHICFDVAMGISSDSGKHKLKDIISTIGCCCQVFLSKAFNFHLTAFVKGILSFVVVYRWYGD